MSLIGKLRRHPHGPIWTGRKRSSMYPGVFREHKQVASRDGRTRYVLRFVDASMTQRQYEIARKEGKVR